MRIVITGNPGVGKHTIAELFIKQDSSYKIFDISKFAIEKGFGEQMDDSIEIDTAKIKNEINRLDLEKSIIVGHLAPYVLDESNIDLAIILRKNPYDLIEIYNKRNYQKLKIKENAGSEILGIIANDSITSFGKAKSFEVNTTDKTPEKILKEIDNIIYNQKSGDIVDWLELVEKRDDFDRFF